MAALTVHCTPPASSSACTDNSVATDGNDDTASVQSWADRCGKCQQAEMWFSGSEVVIDLVVNFRDDRLDFCDLKMLDSNAFDSTDQKMCFAVVHCLIVCVGCQRHRLLGKIYKIIV